MRFFSTRLAAVTALAALTATAQKKPVTLEALGEGMMRSMGAMMAGQPLWAPDGKRFVFRQGSKVILYDVASQSKKDFFSTEEMEKAAKAPPAERAMGWENRRVSEQRMQWSKDGKKMLLLINGDIFVWDSETGKSTQVTATAEVTERDPKLSPDGARVSFRRGNELYAAEVTTKKITQLTFDSSATRWNARLDWVYPEELDLGTAHWWSPDSRRIAYLQFDVSREPVYPHGDFLQMSAVAEPQRYPKAGTPNADVRVGVVGAEGGETKWMDYGETRDFLIARVHWTPDSKQLVVHRFNRIQNHLMLMAADAGTGTSRTLIEEKDPAWINLRDDLRFLSNGSILRSSEKDGFRHLYLYAENGKEERQITKGEWEVASVACVDGEGKRVWYVSSEGDPMQRQLYVTGFDGRGKRQLTKGEGTHSISMSPACDYYMDTHSNLENPSRATLHKGEDGAEIAVYREADRKAQEEYEILKTEIHKFKGADGTVFYGRLIKPANFDPAKKYPAIVQVYGGPGVGGAIRNANSGLSMDQVYAHRGFVIWQMDNRGTGGRGHKFETPIHRRLGKQELEDQNEGIKYLVSLGFVDPARIGVTGWSYGGFMTLNCLLNAPEVFKAGVAGAAVTDWRNYDTIYTERYMGLPQENAEGYKSTSLVGAAANLKGKLLLIHNIEDDNVLFANALQMMNAFQQANKPFETMIYPQKSHGVTGRARRHMMEQQLKFFEEALK